MRSGQRYHKDDEPGYDSDIYYCIHPALGEYLDSLTECDDMRCDRNHAYITVTRSRGDRGTA